MNTKSLRKAIGEFVERHNDLMPGDPGALLADSVSRVGLEKVAAYERHMTPDHQIWNKCYVCEGYFEALKTIGRILELDGIDIEGALDA